ncbi:MAG TPA: hypothetical protein VL179_11640, partial [Mycobacterium sp.]|nr:hypothetical protein [Mycobacterium sp.]
MLTVADIQRWDADAVREVFHAATARAAVTASVSRELSTLAVFETWGGPTAQAARHANAAIRQDLDVHGAEAIAVARAASRAADGIEHVQHELAALQIFAQDRQLAVDPLRDLIVPGPGTVDFSSQMWAVTVELQSVLNNVLDTANGINNQLADAINMADGDKPIPAGPHDRRPAVQQALIEGMPEDPRRFHDLWDQLTREEKDWLYAQDHAIGNRPGMVFADKDRYNRLHLDELTAAAEAERDRLAAEHPDWAVRPPPLRDEDVVPADWPAWFNRWANVNRRLDGYRSVRDGLGAHDGAPSFLGLVDADGHAAIAIGDPDHAKRTAV